MSHNQNKLAIAAPVHAMVIRSGGLSVRIADLPRLTARKHEPPAMVSTAKNEAERDVGLTMVGMPGEATTKPHIAFGRPARTVETNQPSQPLR